MYDLRIILADADPFVRKNLREILTRAGYLVVAEAEEGRTASQLAFNRQPDLVILDVDLPVRNGLEVARVLEEQRVAPVLLLVGEDYWRVVDRVNESGAYGCLVKPVTEAAVVTAVETAWAGFQRLRKLEDENKQLKENLATRKLIEKAKGILMERKNIHEEEAYRLMRKLAMDTSIPLVRVAKRIIKDEPGGLL